MQTWVCDVRGTDMKQRTLEKGSSGQGWEEAFVVCPPLKQKAMVILSAGRLSIHPCVVLGQH